MIYNYNFNNTYPWVYDLDKYENHCSQYINYTRIPNVNINQCYYTKVGEYWTAVKIKSFVLINNNLSIIVQTPYQQHCIHNFWEPFFNNKEDVEKYLLTGSRDNQVLTIEMASKLKTLFVNADFVDFSNCDFIKFSGFYYKSGTIKRQSLSIKYLWIDENGLHYQLDTEQPLYLTRESAVRENLIIADFEGFVPKENEEKEYSVIVTIKASSYEDAMKKIKIINEK